MRAFENEAKEKWGHTAAYKEHAQRTKNYSKEKWNDLAEGIERIIAEFALCMRNGNAPDSDEVQSLVKMLQNHITENYYHCTDEILAGLGQMYVADQRFKYNIDQNGDGTAAFICKAIEIYCKR